MKNISTYIAEKLKISSSSKGSIIPKSDEDLFDIMVSLIRERSMNGDFNDIDTSNITDMGGMFSGFDSFNGDISQWDVSNVKNMGGMFNECRLFNCDISNWDVSSVTNMSGMFSGCRMYHIAKTCHSCLMNVNH